jgi:SAM-dependent methyltransferase
MAPYYQGGYDPIPASVAELRQIAAGEKYRTEPALAYKSRGLKAAGRCLEIGPWRGVICSNMKDAGFEVTAIEMDSKCVEFLRREVGIDAIQSGDPAGVMKRLQPGYEVIISWHSLEHIPNAWSVIEEAGRLLAVGGVLLLAMPNPDSFELSLLKGAWFHLDAPRHVCLFPVKTLIEVCEKNNLKLVEITSADTFSEIQSSFTWRMFAQSLIPVRYIRGALGITLGKLLYWLAYPRQMSEGKGSAYTAIFTRTTADRQKVG